MRMGLAVMVWVFAGVIAGVSAGCAEDASRSGTTVAAGPPYRITTTTGMITDIVQQVVGQRGQVTGLMPQGTDPHLYKASRGDLIALNDAHIIFYNGLLLEGKMAHILEKLGQEKPVHAVSDLLERQYLLDAEGKHHDPHIWMDVKGWMSAVRSVAKAMSDFDPEGAEIYAANAQRYLAELEKLDVYAAQSLASIPAQQRVLVTAHDAFSYLGRAYDIEVRGIQGISTESEAGVRDINELVVFLVERRIGAVFVESSVKDKNVRALLEGAASRGHDVIIGGTLFSDAMGKPGTYEGTYIGMIDHNVTTITRSLGGQAPAKGMQGKLTGPESDEQ